MDNAVHDNLIVYGDAMSCIAVKRQKGGAGATGILAVLLLSVIAFVSGCATVPLPNFHEVNNAIYRGGRPTEEGIRELAKMGVKTIVNLESGFFAKDTDDVLREAKWAKEAGINFIKVPMHPIYAPKAEEVNSAYEAISNKENQPVFVHCLHGSDRTGTVVASYRIFTDGWTFDKAFAEMKEYGHSALLYWWKDVIRKFLAPEPKKEAQAAVNNGREELERSAKKPCIKIT